MDDLSYRRGGVLVLLILLSPLVLFSCRVKSSGEYESARTAGEELDRTVRALNGKNLSTKDVLEGLDKAEALLPLIQEGREKMSLEADRLTRESYELNSKNIEKLKEDRMELYGSIDDFLVCSYRLCDLVELSVYYHDRSELLARIREIQKTAITIIQGDAPHSAASTFSYYKNLAKITGQTADEEGGWFYTIKVNIGYNFNEKNTQTLLNSSKQAMGGIIRSYFSGLTRTQVVESDENEIKAGLVMAMNDYLIQFSDFSKKKMEGVKLVTFDMIQYYEFH